MKHKPFPTRDHAIRELIIDPIEADLALKHHTVDVDAVAAEVLEQTEAGYAIKVSRRRFWTIVARHAHAI
jgi:hypothetical protein